MRPSIPLWVLPALMLAACQQGTYHQDKQDKPMAEVAAIADSASFSNDITSLNSASRKRVRTADVRCRVRNVYAATSRLEQAVNGVNGVVVESALTNDFGAQTDLPYSADSLRHIQLYTPTANLTLRVPTAQLDSVVAVLTNNATFIDHRNFKDTDYTLAYLSNSLRNNQPVEEKVKPGKGATPLQVAQYHDGKRESSIDRKIENMEILDNVHYATFTVQLFQPQEADVQIIVNPERITRAGFGTELLTALRNGADIFRNVLLFFLQLWPFLLLLTIGLAGYRRWFSRSA
ncbi:DUF4349 domain-containing protein [Chitinophaga vietnamensis]|uniref:DUF4349 domain-containing protein n=1 Tax=Chitinophaga vietnamensis TaxID=2593957 RepID=UPI0011776E07|nr:DUF4349 domain-containing protein [Chitinophaga vietnamensis]